MGELCLRNNLADLKGEDFPHLQKERRDTKQDSRYGHSDNKAINYFKFHYLVS